MLIVSLRSKFHLPVSSGSFIIIISETKHNICVADVFRVLDNITSTKIECFSRFITILGLVSVPPQNFPLSSCHY